jgi:LuxR family transcriptional regulator, maltose regulon positive regulatory protein
VVSVCAPAGYGKTTLLAQWAAADERPFGWVSLDNRDNDPAVFLTYLAGAANRIEPVDAAVFSAAASGADSIWTTALPQLGAALTGIDKPIVLVLDDVQALNNRDCLDALLPLSKLLPQDSQLVLSGRADDGLPLARLRAAGRLLELNAADLALTHEEARLLVAEVGVDATNSQVDALNERAEGWVVGLYLATRFAHADGEADFSAFHGDDRFVADYLRDEVFSRLKRSELEFLRRTSILDRMSAGLCDAVLERSDSARRLQSLEQGHFLVPLDHQRGWYRYHHLVQETLRSELERLEPELAGVLHARASAWCDGHDLPDAAMSHAAAAGDMDEVARLVTVHALPFYRSGRVVTLEGWLAQLDDPDLLPNYPAIAAFGAFVNALRGRPEEAERFSYALEHSAHEGPMLDRSSSSAPWAAVVRALLCRHGIHEMRADASLALDELAPGSFWRPVILGLFGVSLLFDGEVEQAAEVLAKGAEEAVGAGAIFTAVVTHSELALLALERDELDRAAAELAGAHDVLQNHPLQDSVGAAIYLAVKARLTLKQGQAATARDLLVRAMRLRPQLTHAIPWFGVQVRLELARTHLALGDVEGARTLYREASDMMSRRPELGTLRAQARELQEQLSKTASLDDGWASTLTAAELRLLPLLTTHLSFREIAERLFVSRNTVKSQAISVYRKLGASSRSEAIERALELGLVDAPVASSASFTPLG